jgi:tetratricopeptide (TPR) repeat protein
LDEITLAVARSLSKEVGMFYEDQYPGDTTVNVEAWLLNKKGAYHYSMYTREDNAIAMDLSKRVIELDPNYARGYLGLSACYAQAARYGWAPSRKEAMIQAKKMAEKALELDESLPNAYTTLGNIHLIQRNYDDALLEFRKAVDLIPNSSIAHSQLARCLFFVGQLDEALSINKTAERLDPLHGWGIPLLNGKIYYHMGRYEEALAEFEKVKTICSRGDCPKFYPHLYLAMVYGKAGQDKEARLHMEKALEIKPKFNLEARSKTQLHKNKEDTERENEGLRKAGAPEHPPS